VDVSECILSSCGGMCVRVYVKADRRGGGCGTSYLVASTTLDHQGDERCRTCDYHVSRRRGDLHIDDGYA
jgi:hypothetical protein